MYRIETALSFPPYNAARPNSLLGSSLQVGIQTLRVNPLRTVLSTLGVIMGVASIVAVLAIGDGVERYARTQIEETTDLLSLVVLPTTADVIDQIRVPRTDFPVFTSADADSLSARLAPRARAAILLRGPARVTVRDSVRGAAVTALSVAPPEWLHSRLAAGRSFSAMELHNDDRVAIVSAGLAAVLAPGVSADSVVGRTVLLEGHDFRIIGVLAASTGRTELSALVPITVADQALAPVLSPRAPSLLVRSERVEEVPAIKAEVERWLTGRLGAWHDRATVSGGQGLRLDQTRQAILIFKLVMGTFAGISLVVGGIGIMNVLLASVTERTREIGIRKAAGARGHDILLQFLAESVAITSVGSVIGMALGLAGAFLAAAMMRHFTRAELYAAFTWTTLLVAALVSVVTGLVFGTYPALRAARLSAIDAIRHE